MSGVSDISDLTLPYLTLPYVEDVLPPNAEASNGHYNGIITGIIAHPELTVRLQYHQVQYSPGSTPTLGTTPLPSEGLLTWTYLQTCTLGISKRISARKHIRTFILVTMTSKTPNQENPETHLRIKHKATKSPKSPKCNTDLGPLQNWNHINLVTEISKLHQGAFSKHTLYIDSTSYPLGKSASGGRRHTPVVSWAEQESCRQPKPSKSHHISQLPTTDPQWYILSKKMPCANTP